MAFRRCCGCRKTRGSVPAAGGWLCDGCARDFGVFGPRPRNVAEQNSQKYRDTELCKRSHNKLDIVRYKKGGRNWEKGTCSRCGTVVYDAQF